MDDSTKIKLQQANARIRDVIRDSLKHATPDLYAEYRKIRYPGGNGTDTDETRAKSVVFLFDTAREIVAPHYVRTPEPTVDESGLDDHVEEEEEDGD